MIGKKRLAEVRASLTAECAKAGIDPRRWFDEQIRKLEHGPSPNPLEIETLELIRDGLMVKRSAAKRRRKRAGTRSSD
jgi:hypothetical protein